MNVVGVLRMNGGEGATSYAQNSWMQEQTLLLTKPVRNEAIRKTYANFFPCKSIVIAELGCSSGSTAFSVIHELIQAIDNMFEASLISATADEHYSPPNLQFYLNDLPQNDFNTIFKSLPSFHKRLKMERKSDGVGKCFIHGVPGSFYGRIFEDRSLHFVHSSNSVHWLSKIPEGLGRNNNNNIYISRRSPLNVVKAYYQQFQSDFSTFLKCRSEELIDGGRMVLTLVGRSENQFKEGYHYDLLSVALNQMVLEDLIEEEKMELFNIPIYYPSVKEIEEEVKNQGSFTINRLEVSKVNWDPLVGHPITNTDFFNHEMKGREDTVYDLCNNTTTCLGQSGGGVIPVVRCMRSILEPLLLDHFGKDITEEAFKRYNDIVSGMSSIGKHEFLIITVSLIKNPVPTNKTA